MSERTERIEIAQYAAAVGAALADLPEAERDELLEDLPAHLAEIAAELEAEGAEATLTDRLGPPSAYAAELRATLGHPGGRSVKPSLIAVWEARGRRWDATLGKVVGQERFSAFAVQLRPAWWLLRGYLVAMFITMLWEQGGWHGLMPRIEHSPFLGLLLLVGCLIGSIWWGRRAPLARRPVRLLLVAVQAVLLLQVVPLLVMADSRLMQERWSYPSAVAISHPYEHLEDVYPVGPDGNIINDVRLIDQSGNPILLGRDCGEDQSRLFKEVQYEWAVTYPRCSTVRDVLPWLENSQPRAPWQLFAAPIPSEQPGHAQPSDQPGTVQPSDQPVPDASLAPEPSATTGG